MQPPVLFGLTGLGVFHTIISIVALVAGIWLFVRDGKISWDTSLGKVYVIATIIACITGFGIFQHSGFGKGHILGVITLIVLLIAFLSGSKTHLFGGFSPYVELVSYSLTFLFHVIPTITESATRLPLDAPLYSSPEDPHIAMFTGICAGIFFVGLIAQIRKLKKQRAA